jgi:hypothetical protein
VYVRLFETRELENYPKNATSLFLPQSALGGTEHPTETYNYKGGAQNTIFHDRKISVAPDKVARRRCPIQEHRTPKRDDSSL